MSWYNDEYQHGAIRVATPSQRHDCPDVVVLAHPREAPLPVAPSDGRGQLECGRRPTPSPSTRTVEARRSVSNRLTHDITHQAATLLTLTEPPMTDDGRSSSATHRSCVANERLAAA